MQDLQPESIIEKSWPRWRSLTSHALDSAILLIPIGSVLIHCYQQQIHESLTQGRLALVAGTLALKIEATIYTILVGTTLGIIFLSRLVSGKRILGRTTGIATTLVLIVGFGAAFTGQIGSDSVGELTHTNWTETKIYCLQSLQTINLDKTHLEVAGALALLFLFVSGLAKGQIYKPNAMWTKVSVIILLGSFVGCLAWDISALLADLSSFSRYRQILQTGDSNELANFRSGPDAPLVFVYIGESTERTSFYRELRPAMDNPALAENTIMFSQIVSPHSHTFLSLFRDLSVSHDVLLDQLTRDRDLVRPSLISILNSKGATTSWYSNQPGDDWTGTLFGGAATDRQFFTKDARGHEVSNEEKDSEILPQVLLSLKKSDHRHHVTFFHSYAGHSEYCKNILETEATPQPDPAADFSYSAVYGDMFVLSVEKQQQSLNCYRKAMSYVAGNVQMALRQVSTLRVPAVLIYFSDHGEDVFEANGHDSSRPSFRKIEVPLVVYFNQAARNAYGQKFEAAKANQNAKYNLGWIAESILDISNISYNRPLLSIFQPLQDPPRRYSSLRVYRGEQFAIPVDGETDTRSTVRTTDIDLYAKQQLIQSLPATQQQKICAHRADSLLKFRDASRVFPCSEVDLAIEPQQNEVFIYHPPKHNTGLTLGTLLAIQPEASSGIWLDVKNTNETNLEFLHGYLNHWLPQAKRKSVLIEVSLDTPLNDRLKTVLSEIRQAGYGLSFYLPSDKGIQCSSLPHSAVCKDFAKAVEDMLQAVPFSSLSFDIRAKGFALSIKRPAGTEINTWDLSVNTVRDVDLDILGQSTKYLVPYKSSFDY